MNSPLHILVAEDDASDVLLLKRAFAQTRMAPVHYASDGEEVLAYLAGKPPFENPVRYPLPHLLLLDLKLPRMDGFEVLRCIRGQLNLRHLLVVVFSGSNLQTDIDKAYEYGANSYVVKPHGPRDLVAVVQRLETYWAKLNVRSTGETINAIFSGAGR